MKTSDHSNNKCLLNITFGKLKVIGPPIKVEKSHYCYLTLCECGTTKYILRQNLLSGNTKSCGCSKQLGKVINMQGKIFGRLTVIGPPNTELSQFRYPVICTCGNTCLVFGTNLRNGHTTSCGCIKNRNLVNSPIYKVWQSMKQRCNNPASQAFKHYGGRGIKICASWESSSETFINWAIVNGWKKGLELNRKDNNKGYYPENCDFVSRRKNMQNTRLQERSKNLPGVTRFHRKFAARIGLNKKTIPFGLYNTEREATQVYRFATNWLDLTVSNDEIFGVRNENI